MLTEQKLAAAVIGLLGEVGLEKCTVPAVARRAGVAVGTVYRRYADKDALVAAALLDFVSLGEGRRESDYSKLVNDAADLSDFLRRIAETAIDVTSQQRTLLMAIRTFSRSAPQGEWRAQFQSQLGRGREAVVRAAIARFGPVIRGGEQRLRFSLAALYGAVEAVWFQPQSGLFLAPPPRDEFIDAFVEMQTLFLARS